MSTSQADTSQMLETWKKKQQHNFIEVEKIVFSWSVGRWEELLSWQCIENLARAQWDGFGMKVFKDDDPCILTKTEN